MCPDLGRGFMDSNTPGLLRRDSGLSIAQAGKCLFCNPWSFASPCRGRRRRRRMSGRGLAVPLRWLLLHSLKCTKNKPAN